MFGAARGLKMAATTAVEESVIWASLSGGATSVDAKRCGFACYFIRANDGMMAVGSLASHRASSYHSHTSSASLALIITTQHPNTIVTQHLLHHHHHH